MKSLSNRLLLILAGGSAPILLLQAATVTGENAIVMTLVAAADGVFLLLAILLSLRLARRAVIRLPDTAGNRQASQCIPRSGPSMGITASRAAAARVAVTAMLDAGRRAWRTVLERVPDTAVVLDHAYRLVFRRSLAEALQPPCPELLVLPFSHPDPATGRAIWLQGRGPRPGGGARRGVSRDGRVTVCRAVAEKQQTAAALQDSEQRLGVALAGARLGVRELDLVTGTGTWTPDAAEILGRAHCDDASFDAWLAAIHPDDQAGVLASWQRALAAAENYHEVEYRFRQHDGSWRWIAAYGRVMFEADRPVRVISVVQDVSARKRVEAALKESETRLRLAREAAGIGIWDWDLLTGEGMWSPDQWRLWGMQPRPGAPSIAEWEAAIHKEDRAQQAAARDAVFAGASREVDHEFRVVWPDGQVRWLLVKATLLRNPHGHLVRIVGITLDVTPSREAEAELRRLSVELRARMDAEVAAREAAQARAAQAERMHALGQLAGGIAHDVNNVLQTVSGAIALIAHHPDDQVAIRRLVGLAESATRRGAAITSRLLAFSRGDEPALEPIAAADLLHGLREILEHTLGPGIDIAIRPGSGLAPFTAERSQLETSLINLATNARDAMPQGGRLTFSAAVETVPHDAPPHDAGLAPGRYMRLGVADNGTGMDAATLARATEPFFTTKAAGVGTGLGLAMAKGFATQSGGGMTVESSPGQGTTVTLWLPVGLPVAAAGAAAAQAAAPGPGDVAAVPGTAPPHPLVLLVDDDAPLRETLALVLEDAGYRVVQATDGRAALALLATGPAIDALVTDLSMPGLDGVAVIRAAQARCPGLPAVLLTGYAGDGTMRGGTMIEGAGTCSAGAGTYALLCKPVTAPQLADCLGALLGMRPEAAPSRAPLRAKQSAAESQAERRWNLSGASLGPEWSAPRELRGALA